MITRLYPKAVIYEQIEHGNEKFKPKGITIHYTAGSSAGSSIRFLRKNTNYRYHFIIERNGTPYQLVYLTSSIYHAGKAEWRGFNPNKDHIALALANFGKLDMDQGRFYTQYGRNLSSDLVAKRDGEYWEAATTSQIQGMISLIVWLCNEFRIDPDNVCGHSECSPGRKIDPGGILPYTMAELRLFLKEKVSFI